MKVAVTAQAGVCSAPIDPRFGRAPWFVVVDTETGGVQAHDNRVAAQAAEGAGAQAAGVVAACGARAVITGNVGPKALRALQEAGIVVYLAYAGTVAEVVDRLRADRLRQAKQPTRRGHG